jgi:DNA-binding transcriptional ArsR family regulator
MNATYPIAAIAELIGDPARSGILIALLGGRALPAGELARIAGISAQSASSHLSQLVNGGLLTLETEGRYRYYKIARPEVAHALEALGAISTFPRPGNISQDRQRDGLYLARSCYDHLAGRIAVEMARALESLKVIRACGNREYEIGPRGNAWFSRIGVEPEDLRRSRRVFARACLDWTERKPHIAGALGAAIFSRFVELGWIVRRAKTRAVRITQTGSREFHRRLGICVTT